MSEQKRVLILTADAGFGHRSAANAVAAALAERFGDQVVVDVVNPLDDRRTPPFLRDVQSDYDKVVSRMPDLYKLNYQISDSPVPAAVLERALTVLLFRVIRSIVKDYQPSVVVITHNFYMAPLGAYTALRNLNIPYLTVITDMTDVHRLWFDQGADMTLLPTQEAYEQGLAHGMAVERMQVTGIPVRPIFANERRPKQAIRAELGWAVEPLTVLATGSKRVKNLMNVLHLLNHSGLPVQFALVAGGDDNLYAEFKSTEWHRVTHLYNYVENMPQLMFASDLIISKAGGLTVTESLACGLPLLLADVTPGQEEGNAQYVVEHGAGEMARNPVEALEILFHWLDRDHQLLLERARIAATLGRPYSGYRVAEAALQAAEHSLLVPKNRPRELIPKLKELLRTFDISEES
jgi:1,2-diacylglycerol 3-beta-galactosyltransferase